MPDEVVDGDQLTPPVNDDAVAAQEPSGDSAKDGGGKAEIDWVKELEKRDKRLDDLNAHLQSRTDKLMARFDSVLEKLSANPPGNAAEQRAHDQKLKDYRDEVREKYDKGELSGEEMLSLIEASFSQAETRAGSKVDETRKALEAKIAAMESKLADLDPVYVSQREKVAAIQAEFKEKHGVELDRKTAMAIAAREAPRQPARPQIPGGTGGGVPRGGDDDGGLSADEQAILESLPGIGKLKDSEKAALRKARK